jgi:phosphoserine phosphatase RsbU/P
VRFSIRNKLLLTIGIPLVIAYGVMLVSEYVFSKRTALTNAKVHLTEVAARWAAEFERELVAAEELAQAVAGDASLSPTLSADGVRATLQYHIRNNSNIYGMCAAFEPGAFPGCPALLAPYYCRDAHGGLRYVDVAAVSPHYAELAWYRPARSRGDSFWTEPYFDTGIGERIMCTIVAPIVREGKFRGVVTADLLADHFVRELAKVEIGYCVLLSPTGVIISHPDRSLILHETIFSLARRRHLDDLAEAGRQMVAGESGAQEVHDVAGGPTMWMVYAPIRTAGWSLAAVISESTVTARIRPYLVRLSVILLATLAVILSIVLLASVYITHPIGRLALASESLGHGNLDARVPESRGNDEIAQLARRFNAMVTDLKTNVAVRIREEAARREIEGELRAARAIQASLLPGAPPAEEQQLYTLDAQNAPAKVVAGDFYDFFPLDARRLVLAMADVSGKGTPAAIYMAVTRTMLRSFAAADRTPAEVVAEVNRRLVQENDQGMFVTLFLAYYDLASGELHYVNAGHNAPYVVRGAGALETLDATGPLVGVLPDAEFRDGQTRLEPGELLFLFTDGITEAGAGQGELFGEQRLQQFLAACASQPVSAICTSAIDAVRAFAPGDLGDDATVLALRRTSPAAES